MVLSTTVLANGALNYGSELLEGKVGMYSSENLKLCLGRFLSIQKDWYDKSSAVICDDFIRRHFIIKDTNTIRLHISESKMKESVSVYLQIMGSVVFWGYGEEVPRMMHGYLERGIAKAFPQHKNGKPFKVWVQVEIVEGSRYV